MDDRNAIAVLGLFEKVRCDQHGGAVADDALLAEGGGVNGAVVADGGAGTDFCDGGPGKDATDGSCARTDGVP